MKGSSTLPSPTVCVFTLYNSNISPKIPTFAEGVHQLIGILFELIIFLHQYVHTHIHVYILVSV